MKLVPGALFTFVMAWRSRPAPLSRGRRDDSEQRPLVDPDVAAGADRVEAGSRGWSGAGAAEVLLPAAIAGLPNCGGHRLRGPP